MIALLEDREQARFILDLLHYDDDVAGGLMQKELIKINVNLTVNACIEEIQAAGRRRRERVCNVYVVDDVGKLLGSSIAEEDRTGPQDRPKLRTSTRETLWYSWKPTAPPTK